MTEQELNKACEWLNNTLPDIEYITSASALRQNKQQFIDTFRKAMTEKTNSLFEQALANVNPDTRAEVRGNMEFLDKACEWLEKYMESLGYIDEWCRTGEDTFRKAMVVKESLTTELTWQDVQEIVEIVDAMIDEDIAGEFPEHLATPKAYYTEILNRFKEIKED